MSNPGVITLTEKEISANKSFRVEDNLGEAVHFHYNDIRIDLTLKELLYIGTVCDETIYDLVKAKNFNLDAFDGDFLNEYSQCLMELERVENAQVSLDSLYYQTKNFLHLPVRRKLTAARAEKIIERKKKYEPKRKYDSDEKEEKFPIVLFNDNPTIMYGLEQAAEMYQKDSNAEIEILRMYYEKGKYSVSSHPWVPFLFKWNKKRFIKVAKKMAMKLLGK